MCTYVKLFICFFTNTLLSSYITCNHYVTSKPKKIVPTVSVSKSEEQVELLLSEL